MMSNRLKIQMNGEVLEVTLARPAVRNAFDSETIAELTKVFLSAAISEPYTTARVLVLNGEGPSFCSGADLAYMESMAKFSDDENRADADRLFAMFESVLMCAIPVIVIAHGHAMGGALGITACADIALAEVGTQMRFSEVRLGILPAVISPFVLRKMDASWARRWMMTGESFDAEQARAAGLFQFVGSAKVVLKEKEKVITAILEAGPMAVRKTKALLNEIALKNPEEVRRDVTDAIAERRTSVEGREGLGAFLTKRDPSWRGAKASK
jgi:methylglutaconyl-CoA hydratase